jgi:beta-N-acetylhexosaminidase
LHSITLSAAFAALAACAPPAQGPLPPTPPRPLPVASAPPTPGVDLDRLLGSLSVRERAAQLVMAWLPGVYAARDDPALADADRLVDSLQVGGFIVSVGSPLDLAAKLNQLQTRSRLPLLVASDLEAGTAIRLIGGTAFPTNMGIGAGSRESDAYEMGRVTAEEGRAVGIHLAFAPVADLNNNPANPIINTRSFGEDPREVGRLVAAEVRGVEEHGMLATAKHFPGHGDTGTDSHLSLPVVSADWRRLDSLELVPFRAAVSAGVSAVMSAHIALPALDSGRTRPGTVVPGILTGLLRDSLRFEGLVVTDALEMGGLVSGYGASEAPVLALLAGADLLLQPSDPGATVDALARAVAHGRLSEARLDRSVRRVLALKRRLGLFDRRTVALDSVPRVVGSADHLAAAAAAAARSIVLLRDSLGVVDDMRRRPHRIALVVYGEEANLTMGSALAAELRRAGDTVAAFRLWPASGPASYDSARVALGQGSVALFAVGVRATPWRGRIGIPDALARLIDDAALARRTVLVSLGSPYIITQTPHVGSYLLAWAANPISETAAARALAGAAITGRLPTRVPPAFARGAGLERAEVRRGAPDHRSDPP